ncbi:cytidine deaminase-like protein [Dipodascopsis uninucleata]
MLQKMTDLNYMTLALEKAKECIPTPTAFCVGAVIVFPKEAKSNLKNEDIILSTGYSRELPGNTHAEQCALEKLKKDQRALLKDSIIYTTMEPCSERLSGNLPCVDRIISSGIRSVKVGVVEPDTFVKKNIGKRKLNDHGISYEHIAGLESECLKVAEQGH